MGWAAYGACIRRHETADSNISYQRVNNNIILDVGLIQTGYICLLHIDAHAVDEKVDLAAALLLAARFMVGIVIGAR